MQDYKGRWIKLMSNEKVKYNIFIHLFIKKVHFETDKIKIRSNEILILKQTKMRQTLKSERLYPIKY